MYCLCNKIRRLTSLLFSLFALLFFVAPYAFSQNIIFNTLNTETLLPHPSVNSIVQDQQGFIWFGTQNGLSRYDGKKVKHFFNQPNQTNSLGNNWITALYSDNDGRLWVGSSNGIHLYIPETESFTNFSSEHVINKSISGITEDDNGTIWFSTSYSGVISYTPTTGKFKSWNQQTANLISNEISDVLIDNNNRVWLASIDQGLMYKDANQETFQAFSAALPSSQIQTLYLDRNNALWVGTENAGVFVIENGLLTSHHMQAAKMCSASILDIFQDRSGTLWFATENGLCQMTAKGNFIGHKQNNESNHSLTDNRTFTLMQDQGGVMWVGTISGVSKWNASLTYFEHINKMNTKELQSNSVMAFTAVEQNLYIGSWGEGISRLLLPETKHAVTDYDSRLATLSEQNIMTMYVDSKQNLWIGTYRNGLYILPRHSDKIVHLDQSHASVDLTSNSVSTFAELNDGSMLVGTYSGSLNNLIFDQHSLSNTPNHRIYANLPSQYVLDIVKDGHYLWIASSDEGLVRLDTRSHTSFNLFKDAQSFSQFKIGEVFDLFVEKDTIWAATNSGLLRISRPISMQQQLDFELINNQQGLASNFVYGLLKDNRGHIWLSHAKGLSRYTPKHKKLQNFNTTHGLQGVDFNSSALFQTENGRLLFGGNNGFNSFLADDLPINQYQPPLRLTGFKQENKPISVQSTLAIDGHIELQYNQTVVDFEFAALDFTRPENNHYRYKMLGMSDVWHDLGSNNLISFSHLPPGLYELNVQGSNNDGVWSKTMRIPIRVLPPMWQTSSAYLLYGLIILLLASFIYSQQKQKRQKRLAHAKHLHRLAYYDSLTGLPNRQNFYESLQNYLTQAAQDRGSIWVVLFNLDRLKRINDTLGHEFGDKVLIEEANRVFTFLARGNFTSPLKKQHKFHSNFARLGGDEFILLVNQAKGQDEINNIINQLIELISQPIEIDRYQVTVTPSLGIANYPSDGDTVSDLLKHADIALHQAKAEGRRTHKFYSDVLDNKAMERLQIEELMRDAIANNEFELYYQPQVDVKKNNVSKAEALIRWNSPTLGFVSPADFIPIAEESGLIIELGDWILTQACHQAKEWQSAGLDKMRVSVNVSSVQFKQSALLEKIEQALTDSKLAPEQLEIELTESAIMSDLEDNIARLNALKNMGVSIACDDFGTGYSSLSYLKQFPLDTLKIDRSFIQDIATDENDAAIVKAIMLLADTMHLNVVAEGVETIEQLQMLNQYNCELIQGYYFSKPLKQKDFINFVKEDFFQDKFMWELELVGKPT